MSKNHATHAYMVGVWFRGDARAQSKGYSARRPVAQPFAAHRVYVDRRAKPARDDLLVLEGLIDRQRSPEPARPTGEAGATPPTELVGRCTLQVTEPKHKSSNREARPRRRVGLGRPDRQGTVA